PALVVVGQEDRLRGQAGVAAGVRERVRAVGQGERIARARAEVARVLHVLALDRLRARLGRGAAVAVVVDVPGDAADRLVIAAGERAAVVEGAGLAVVAVGRRTADAGTGEAR